MLLAGTPAAVPGDDAAPADEVVATLDAAPLQATSPDGAEPAPDAATGPQAPTPAAATARAAVEAALKGDTVGIEVAHSADRAWVRERLGYLVDYWHTRFGIRAAWHADSVFLTGRVLGMSVAARFDVTDSAIIGLARDPGWLWRGRVERYVLDKLKKYLHPDYADP